jgi:hypothetical protein
VIRVVVQVGVVKISAATAVEVLMKKERHDETQFTTKNWLEKTSLDPSYFDFCKIFIPSYTFDALLCRNWPFFAPLIA